MILNFGSINVDYVYQLAHVPGAGETVHALSHEKHLGGKGVNQSIAIARSGGNVVHVGAVGTDGQWALDQINQFGIDTSSIEKVQTSTGHAVILLEENGENRIVIDAGANFQLTHAQIDRHLASTEPSGNWVLLQNETNLTSYIVNSAREQGFSIAYAAAPFVASTTLGLLEKIDFLAVNEGEAIQLSNELGVGPEEIPVDQLLITRGSNGSILISGDKRLEQSAFTVKPVDTTGAGDTFLGAFLALHDAGDPAEECLRFASASSAIQVTRNGAAPAIPTREEVNEFLQEHAN